jgi:signal transduction histidine kinase
LLAQHVHQAPPHAPPATESDEALLRIARALSAELNLERIVQLLTDEATALCRAEFGAFFYNVTNDAGESYMLYALSGAPREAFARFPMPRNTDVFAPTFSGAGVVRSADIHQDPRYGKNTPYQGMPPGHLPVVSYLAVPVTSRTGEVLGGLFFGHKQADMFSPVDERRMIAVAAHAAIAIDNARLFRQLDEAHARARAARQEAEAANAAKDQFLAMVSHELRTPLSAITGWVGMLRSGSLTPDRVQKALETIDRNARVQVQLIDDLLDVSRILSGKLRLNVAPVEPVSVVDAAIEAVRPAADAKRIRLIAVLDPDAGTLMGDSGRLQQVVWNLLSNAIKFTPKDGKVHVRLRRVESSVEVMVEDDGDGISPSFLPHVFDPFRQGSAGVTRAGSGLGLGLAIVKRVVELHGGRVTAASEGEGRGASFTVRIPIAPFVRPEVDPGASVRRRVSLECPPDLQGLHVLVVDDEPDARELLHAILTECRVRVSLAASAQEGIDLVAREGPDVIVSDIGMPAEDGFSFMRRVRALPGPHIPAVALTAFARTEDRTRALLAGFDMHVPKPVEPSELLVVLSALTARSRRGGP